MSQLTNDISSALWKGDAATVARLLEGQCADELMVHPNVPLLVHACGVPQLPPGCLNTIIQHARDVNITDYQGQNGLMCAAGYGLNKNARCLLAAGAKIDGRDNQGRTALHYAVLVLEPNPGLIQMLTDAGASVAATNHAGETPLHLALRAAHPVVVAKLLEHHAPVNAVTKQGRTPLHYAAESPKADACLSLLAKGASVDATDVEGWTPLLVAIAAWRYPAAQVLLTHGANARARLKPDTHTLGPAAALQLALGEFDGWLRDERDPRREFDRHFFEALVHAGADLQVRTSDGKTLAHLAYNNAAALEYLLEKGVAD